MSIPNIGVNINCNSSCYQCLPRVCKVNCCCCSVDDVEEENRFEGHHEVHHEGQQEGQQEGVPEEHKRINEEPYGKNQVETDTSKKDEIKKDVKKKKCIIL
jgi:hypothetical protein